MEEVLKIYVSGYGGNHYIKWITGINTELVDSIEEADIVLFTGGQDISPALYNERCSRLTYFTQGRDDREVADFTKAKELGKGFIGICRGAQLLCALAGGKLIQDVTRHCGNHPIEFKDGELTMTNSLHHQMMYPYDMESGKYELLAWTPKIISSSFINGDDVLMDLPEGFKEPEVVWFPEIKGFGVQGHPEMIGSNHPFTRILSSYLIKYFNGISSQNIRTEIASREGI